MPVDIPEYIDAPIRKKLTNIVRIVCEHLLKDEVPDRVFVSTSAGPNSLSHLGVWLFIHRFVVEIRNPLRAARVHFEVYRFKEAVDWIRLNARNYEFGECIRESELELEFSTEDGVTGVLSANGEGCGRLMELYREKFIPNFIGTRDEVEKAAEE